LISLKSIHIKTLLHSSWADLMPRRRLRLMMLLPFMLDPYARLMILREIAKSKANYILIQSLSNSAEVIVDLFHHELKWITDHPKDFAFKTVKSNGWTFQTPDIHFSQFTMECGLEILVRFNEYLRLQKESSIQAVLSEVYETVYEGKCPKSEALAAIDYPYRTDVMRAIIKLQDDIGKRFRHLFPKTVTVSEKSGKKEIDFRKIPDNRDMWNTLLFNLAESPAYQGMATARKANMWEALTYMDEKAFQMSKEKPILNS
jgi:hypothetical protein